MNFEDFIFRSAILGQPLHTYVNLSQMGLWVEMYLLPLESDKEGTGYCLYSYTIAPRADENSMSDLAPDTASAVLKSCLIIKNEQDMKVVKERNPEWYKSLTDHNVDSLVIFPIKYNGKLLGYIWATNFDVNNAVKIKEVLELTTFFIGSEIAG